MIYWPHKMLDGSTLLPSSVLRNLADNLYERKKNAAVEVEGILKAFAMVGDHEKISAIITLLIRNFVSSSQPNYRKGGLIGLAAATIGLSSNAPQYLDQIVPPVLKALSDQDSRVRYFACEALYNIAKVSQDDLIVFFNEIFDALCKLWTDTDPNVQSAAHLLDLLVKDIVRNSDQFSIEEFIPLLRERMNVLNPFVRQFLVGWITVLDDSPEIDMLSFLPDFLDGLFNMLSDTSPEIRQQADLALIEFLKEMKNAPSVDYGRMAKILVHRAKSVDEFTCLTAITWINEFVKLGGEQLVPHFSDILGAILPAMAHKEDSIRMVAKETNEEIRAVVAGSGGTFDISDVLSISRRCLESDGEATRIAGLRWILLLLHTHRKEVLSSLNDIFPALLQALSDKSEQVIMLVLDAQACIASDGQHFHQLMVFLVHRFQMDRVMFEKRGALALRHLCVLLDAERVYRELASILEGKSDLEFARMMVQVLNSVLLTAPELAHLRVLLKNSLSSSQGKKLFMALYSSWCHSSMATISLCLLSQAYQLATEVIQVLGEPDVEVKFLVQIDKLVRLLETPSFTFLRLQLIEPARHPALLKALYGLLMLLPQQSSGFKILQTRLKAVSSSALLQFQSSPIELPGVRALRTTSDVSSAHSNFSNRSSIRDGTQRQTDSSETSGDIDIWASVQLFEAIQRQHKQHQAGQVTRMVETRTNSMQPSQNANELTTRLVNGNGFAPGMSVSTWRNN